jgi:4-hydroxy-tetrahydrodipicolinate synthase
MPANTRSALNLARLATVQLVPPTPFGADGDRVLPERLAALVRELFAAGMRVFLPAAGTGEFHSLSADEIALCVRTTREALGAEATVIAPIGCGLPLATAVGRRAVELGADALLVMPPIHPYLCDEGLRDYFRALSDALPLPLLAYKKGPFPSDELLLELCREGRLVGVKYAVNDLDAAARFASRLDARSAMYCGTAERWAPYFALARAQGYTSGAGSICPRLTLALHAALTAGDYDAARRWLDFLRPIEDFRARAGDSYNVGVIKAGLRVAGHDFGPLRPPLRNLSAGEELQIAELLKPILTAERRLAQTAHDDSTSSAKYLVNN